MNAVLVGIYFIITLLSIKVGLLVFYHFKKFDLPDKDKAGKFLLIYKLGSIILISLAFLILMVIIW